jgi:polysaccharide export outer membrane protein
MRKRSIFSSTTFFVALFLATSLGCVGKKQDLQNEFVGSYAAKNETNDEIAQLNERLFASAQMNVTPSDDVIGSGDLLQITVFEAKDLETKARVNSRGCVTLPLLGEVEIRGLSAREAEERIEGLYRRQYIKNPHVSIFVEERFSQRVTVVGNVKSPGTYDYLSKQRLMDVLALVGGLTDTAGRTVQIRRIGSGPGEQGMFIVDLDKLINEGRTELNVEINGGDVIYVPEAGVFFVDGAVRNPGTYRIREKIVLREALIAAGGFASYANEDSVILIRNKKGGERKATEIDLREADGSEWEIKDRDVIIAKDSTWGKMLHGTGINFGIPGFFWIGYRSPQR